MRLRKVTEHDNYLLRDWRNVNAEFFPPRPEGKITPGQQALWYREYVNNPLDHMYMVCAPFALGTVAIDISTAMIHRVLRGREGGEKGAMTRALVELMRIYPFQAYELMVLEGNARAIEFYNRIGFRKIGSESLDVTDPASLRLVRMLCVQEDRL